MTPVLHDMHCHLDFFDDPLRVARDAEKLGLGFFANTVTPDGYLQTARDLCEEPNVHVGVGLHPWWIADGRCGRHDVEQAADLVRTSRFVGEIGLDFSPKHVPAGSEERQLAAFEAVARACAESSGAEARKVLSIHSVRAADAALDILEQTGCLGSCSCIFHWFSGTSDELHRAVKAGCWFSVNEMMLQTRRGREYVRQLPAKQLLLETDLPPGEHVAFSAQQVADSLERTLERMRAIRGADMREIVRANAEHLLS